MPPLMPIRGLRRSNRRSDRRPEHRSASPWLAVTLLLSFGCANGGPIEEPDAADDGGLYHRERQLTFAGLRSGEGYFAPKGLEIVFQSERDPENPFYQIYRMNLETGTTTRVSTGRGKTTCSWIHPGHGVLFASTHLDPNAEEKQATELAERASGKSRRYQWSFDPHYDLFMARGANEHVEPGNDFGRGRQEFERLTTAFGYDAEGSVSPDGSMIVFASNGHAYHETHTPEDRERVAADPSFFIDLYLLELESGVTRRLTWSDGYDGGPFFSPDGKRIIWRRFSEDGQRAEIHSMRVDGSDERILTRLGVMSWAPFYHPSGDYIIFATNLNGFDNSELYIVDSEGTTDPIRVTARPGFDGLPVFSPDGGRLLWTSNRTSTGRSQLFIAAWDDSEARRRLGLPPLARSTKSNWPPLLAAATRPGIASRDLESHIRVLTDDRTAGRRTGTEGEQVAADYLVRVMQSIGLEPGGPEGSFLDPFDFTSGVALGSDNALVFESKDSQTRSAETNRDWRPLAFSRSGEVPASAIVFIGYGLVAPLQDEETALDAYAGLDVRDRWVMAFRGLPHSLEGKDRQRLQRYASLRYKAMVARDHGARGILFVSGPLGRFRNELVPLRFDASLAGTRIAVVSIADDFAARLLQAGDRSLEEIQRQAGNLARTSTHSTDSSNSTEGPGAYEIEDLRVAARVDLETVHASGRNVLGRLRVGPERSRETIVIGAHFDHLGRGEGSGSLASGEDVGGIHSGADDNASGVAVMLEIAEDLATRRQLGENLGLRDFLFAAWSGEELGLLGSAHWVGDQIDPHAPDSKGRGDGIVAYLNFDMVGRLRENLVLQGLGSSPAWPNLLEAAAAPLELSILAQADSYLPTDATSFFANGVPILSVFTGVHSEYHTPRDTLDLLNLDGAAEIAELGRRIAEAISSIRKAPAFRAQETPSTDPTRSGFRVFLGTVPDYAQSGVSGVRLTGVAPKGPASRGGLRGGDIIVEVDGRPIENLYDYTYALEALRVGEPAEVVVLRGEERISLEVVPASRD